MTPAAPPPATLDDEELYCPVCNYNLTGNHGGRCPECGALFDRQALIAAQKSHEITLIPWDNPAEMPWTVRLLGTLRICLFKAERFAFAFSVQPRRTNAIEFFFVVSAATVLAAVLIFWLCAGLSRVSWPQAAWSSLGFAEIVAASLFTAGTVIVAVVSATLIASAVLYSIYPHYDGRHAWRPWLSICVYASAHYLLIAVGLPLTIAIWVLLFAFSNDPRDMLFLWFFSFMFLGWLGCGMLCACTLRAVVEHRTPAFGRAAGAIGTLLAVYLITPIVTLLACGWIGHMIARWLGL